MGKDAFMTKKTLLTSRIAIEEQNSEMHCVEHGTVWSEDVDYDAQSREELGSVLKCGYGEKC